jgi:hypothetical protein
MPANSDKCLSHFGNIVGSLDLAKNKGHDSIRAAAAAAPLPLGASASSSYCGHVNVVAFDTRIFM